jgi:hypothetical protein
VPETPEVKEIVSFIESSTRGILPAHADNHEASRGDGEDMQKSPAGDGGMSADWRNRNANPR